MGGLQARILQTWCEAGERRLLHHGVQYRQAPRGVSKQTRTRQRTAIQNTRREQHQNCGGRRPAACRMSASVPANHRLHYRNHLTPFAIRRHAGKHHAMGTLRDDGRLPEHIAEAMVVSWQQRGLPPRWRGRQRVALPPGAPPQLLLLQSLRVLGRLH